MQRTPGRKLHGCCVWYLIHGDGKKSYTFVRLWAGMHVLWLVEPNLPMAGELLSVEIDCGDGRSGLPGNE